MTLVGAMSNLRVADWLPLDYKFVDGYIPDPIISPRQRIALLEKPYVQTDRDYYFNNETMWFKGYMSYLVPNLRDTLSQTIHVELSDATGKIVATKRYHMDEGTFHGEMVFDKNWQPGLYQVKAYTSWMLNFNPRLIFTKTVNLLAEKEAVRIPTSYTLSADTLQKYLAPKRQAFVCCPGKNYSKDRCHRQSRVSNQVGPFNISYRRGAGCSAQARKEHRYELSV